MGQNSSAIEWTIENFSCWSSQIHGNVILFNQIDASVPSEEERFLELFPRGASGTSDKLVVNIHTLWFLGECELSYIDPSGALIHSESRKVEEYSFETYIGPAFESVIAQIQQNDRFQKDSLTLRFRQKNSHINLVHHVSTVIEVFNTSLTLGCDIFKDSGNKKGTWDCVSKFQYPPNDKKGEILQFSVIKKSTKLEENSIFKLRSYCNSVEKTLAKVSVSFNNSDAAITKYEDFERIISGSHDLIDMPIKDIPINAISMLLQLKVIRNNIHDIYSCSSYYPSATDFIFTKTTRNPAENSSKTISIGDTSEEALIKEMMCLFQDQEFSDIQLHCGPFSFAVHKGILSARSPVFKNMLSSDMREGMSGSVDIKDLDGHTLARFLAFLYSGKVDNLQWDSALKLYYAADKYQVPTLKRECVSVLCSDVSISNVCEILYFADKHQDDELTSVAHGFILKNYNQVLKSKEWMDFVTVDPTLLVKTVTLFAQKDYVGKVKAP